MRANFGLDKDTSKSMILVRFTDLKLAPRLPQATGELQIHRISDIAELQRKRPAGAIRPGVGSGLSCRRREGIGSGTVSVGRVSQALCAINATGSGKVKCGTSAALSVALLLHEARQAEVRAAPPLGRAPTL